MITVCVFCALFWIALGASIGWSRRDGFQIITVFCFLFACTYPVKLIASQYNFAVSNPTLIGENWEYFALAVSNLSALAFVLPLIFWARLPRTVPGTIPPPRGGSFWLVTFLMLTVVSYGSGSLSLLRGEGTDALLINEGLSRPGSAVSAILRDCALAALMLYSAVLADRWTRVRALRRVWLVVLAAAVSYGLLLLSYSKYMAAMPLAVFLLSLNMERVRQRGRGVHVGLLLLIAPVALAAIGVLGYLRGFSTFVTLEPQTSAVRQTMIQLGHTFDAIDNLTFILFRTHDFWWGDLFFAPTVQYIFVGLIPRFFWPSKPLVFGNQFIMERYLPERFLGFSGEVISPSMPGEMIVSGGFFFMLVWSFLLGCLFALLYRSAFQRSASQLTRMIYLWLLLNTFNLLRSGTGVLGALITFTIAASIVLTFAWLVEMILGSRPQPQSAPSIAR